MRRVSESIEKKMRRFPEGQWAVLIGSMTCDDRIGAVNKSWKVIGGDDALSHALEEMMPAIETRMAQNRRGPDPQELLSMPGNAEVRAKKLRKLLSLAWQHHVRGTSFQGSKQMYAVVKHNPTMLFPWWNDVTEGVPFCNTAVDNPEVSEKIFRFLAPKVVEEELYVT
jgi:hypothetical protein